VHEHFALKRPGVKSNKIDLCRILVYRKVLAEMVSICLDGTQAGTLLCVVVRFHETETLAGLQCLPGFLESRQRRLACGNKDGLPKWEAAGRGSRRGGNQRISSHFQLCRRIIDNATIKLHIALPVATDFRELLHRHLLSFLSWLVRIRSQTILISDGLLVDKRS
jgi:hypothetical protein